MKISSFHKHSCMNLAYVIITGLDSARVVERVHAATKRDDDYVVVYVGR